MIIDAVLLSDKGLKKEKNEDNFYIDGIINEESRDREEISVSIDTSQKKSVCFALADGMGGFNAGEEASLMIVKCMQEDMDVNQGIDDKIDSVRDSMMRSHEKIREYRKTVGNCGATCTSFVTDGLFYSIRHIGDCRVYKYSKGKLHRLTEDDTLSARRIDMGFYDEGDNRELGDRSRLYKYLGKEEDIFIPRTSWQKWNPDDILMMCSDGLYNMCRDDEMATIIGQDIQSHTQINDSLKNVADNLMNKAISAGADDNITLMLMSRSDI